MELFASWMEDKLFSLVAFFSDLQFVKLQSKIDSNNKRKKWEFIIQGHICDYIIYLFINIQVSN